MNWYYKTWTQILSALALNKLSSKSSYVKIIFHITQRNHKYYSVCMVHKKTSDETKTPFTVLFVVGRSCLHLIIVKLYVCIHSPLWLDDNNIAFNIDAFYNHYTGEGVRNNTIRISCIHNRINQAARLSICTF